MKIQSKGITRRRQLKSHNMSILTCDVARRLGMAQSAELRMRELADHVRMIYGGPTRLADRIERDGLINRSCGAEDLRGYESVGRKALRRANRQHVKDVRELFLDHVTQEDIKGSRRDILLALRQFSRIFP
jgi:DNA-binding MarR family transcriptional regulator